MEKSIFLFSFRVGVRVRSSARRRVEKLKRMMAAVAEFIHGALPTTEAGGDDAVGRGERDDGFGGGGGGGEVGKF